MCGTFFIGPGSWGVKRKTWVDFKSQKMKKTNIESNDAFDMHKIYAWVHKVDIHIKLP